MRIGRLVFLSLCTWLPSVALAQDIRDTIRVDSSRVAEGYDLTGITVRVARPALTTGGSSAVVLELDSLGALPACSAEKCEFA